MDNDSYEILESGIATQNNSKVVNGVAIGEDDTTRGMSGKKTRWPKEALQDGVDKLIGVPIVKDHPGTQKTEEGLQVDSQPPISSKVGEVTDAKYKDGVGLIWQGEISDPEMLEKVEQGLAEVSPVLSREIKPVEGEEDVFEATTINAIRDIGIVSRGASSSNSIQTGMAAMSAEALASEFNEGLKSVAGVSFTGTKDGKLDEDEIESDFDAHYLYGSGENKGDYSYPVVDADGNLRKGNVESAWELGCRGKCPSDETHDEKLRSLASEFETPPEWATDEAMSPGASGEVPASVWEACSVMQSDDGVDSQSSAANNNTNDTMSEQELSSDEEAILAASKDLDDPVEVLEEYSAAEQPTITEQEEVEALEEQIAEIEGFMREALGKKTDLKESTLEALGFEALRAEFEDEDGEFEPEALVQVPETESPDKPSEGVEALSEDADLDKAEALYEDYQTYGVEGLKDDITEALCVSEWDDAKEVLD